MNAPANWYEDFFSGLMVDFWRAAMSEEATRAEAEFLLKHLGLSPGSRVLDVPCGDGRLSLALSARGCRVSGVDISEEFLAAARASARERRLELELRQADMRDLPPTGNFDAAFCFGNSFSFLDDAGNVAFLDAVARTLRPGGRFALSWGHAAESVFPSLRETVEAEISGFRFFEDNRYDPASGRVENRYTISRGERSETRLASQRVYMLSELTQMLRAAGLDSAATFASTEEEPFRLGSPVLLLVAVRAASPVRRGRIRRSSFAPDQSD